MVSSKPNSIFFAYVHFSTWKRSVSAVRCGSWARDEKNLDGINRQTFFFLFTSSFVCYFFVAGRKFWVTGFNLLAFWRPRLFKSHTIGRFSIIIFFRSALQHSLISPNVVCVFFFNCRCLRTPIRSPKKWLSCEWHANICAREMMINDIRRRRLCDHPLIAVWFGLHTLCAIFSLYRLISII